ncbi:BMP family ABC transporter substrate-binding protein [Clostridium sp. CX1]|uniref:BMP family ABC transporter substrate-binding protein n=1 Tax=Clostridium tanneri TaxID=3037988 RepID=A0ABU4JRK2_9CLOT|nr:MULTISPECIES: BMP family ABC transporter substrate-binding protein [unclassified Clostridium]MCT8975892.1 BMP family ABC transporter substrate-binding protein [Clostridium sp. CX1]MDW8800748.1 BMP family ABC transporter substrate-binding protein [Clostridium sp. A1-XYC3]
MNKKRVVSLLAAAIMTVSVFAGCGSQKQQGGSGTTEAKQVKIGLATDEGGLNDKSFNQAADEGIKKAQSEFKNIDYKPIESKKKDEFQPNLQALVDNGSEIIFGVGYQMADAMTDMAKKYPDKKFAIIDSEVKEKNVVSLNFKEQEGSFLAGVIAGKMTKSNKLGFVGGKDFELINRFAAGYMAGAKAVNPSVQFDVRYAADYANPTKGEELATSMINGGCDVIYHASGGTGLGVFKAAKAMTKADKKIWAIGVDMDQSLTVPEYADVILTSMIKRVDTATYDTAKSVVQGKFEGGKNIVFGLKEQGVDIAATSNKNTPKDVLDLVEKYRKAIIDGKITVPATKEDAAKFTAPAI